MSEYFSVFGFFIWSFATAVFSALGCAIVFDTAQEKNHFKFSVFTSLVIGALFGVISLQIAHSGIVRDKEEVAAEQAWKDQGCPVYKTQCGSKHPYACERKGDIIGRNRVGDIFVEAYGTCSK